MKELNLRNMTNNILIELYFSSIDILKTKLYTKLIVRI